MYTIIFLKYKKFRNKTKSKNSIIIFYWIYICLFIFENQKEEEKLVDMMKKPFIQHKHS